jgi:hypothetical protein
MDNLLKEAEHSSVSSVDFKNENALRMVFRKFAPLLLKSKKYHGSSLLEHCTSEGSFLSSIEECMCSSTFKWDVQVETPKSSGHPRL